MLSFRPLFCIFLEKRKKYGGFSWKSGNDDAFIM